MARTSVSDRDGASAGAARAVETKDEMSARYRVVFIRRCGKGTVANSGIEIYSEKQ
jgi:hypothetical protein